MLNYLDDESEKDFNMLKHLLDNAGIKYTVNPRLVRGLDYYQRTVFEYVSTSLDSAQTAVGGGGRYDGLMNSLGGSDVSGIGFGLGVDRILMACQAEGSLPDNLNQIELFIAPISHPAKALAFKLLTQLRIAGISCDMAFGDRALKGAMKAADKSGAKYGLVIGDDEIKSGMGQLKLMSSGEVLSSSLTPSELIKRLGKNN